MANFKNIKIKMKGGGSRLQRVKVLASGKYKFVKNLTKSKSKSKRSNPSPSMKKARKVYKKLARKKKTRRSGGMTIPLAPIAGLAAGLGRPIQEVIDGNYADALWHLTVNYTGVDTKTGIFHPNALATGLVPLVVGLLVHKFVGGAPLNLNRILARAKVPFIRI